MTLHRNGLVYVFHPRTLTKSGFLRKDILKLYRQPLTRELALQLQSMGVDVYIDNVHPCCDVNSFNGCAYIFFAVFVCIVIFIIHLV